MNFLSKNTWLKYIITNIHFSISTQKSDMHSGIAFDFRLGMIAVARTLPQKADAPIYVIFACTRGGLNGIS